MTDTKKLSELDRKGGVSLVDTNTNQGDEMKADYDGTGQATAKWSNLGKYGTVEIPVHHDRRKDTVVSVILSRQQMEQLRDALDAALKPSKEDLIDGIMEKYQDEKRAELYAELDKKRAELEALDVDDLMDPTKPKRRTIDDE